jgi:hypothetical protein
VGAAAETRTPTEAVAVLPEAEEKMRCLPAGAAGLRQPAARLEFAA